MGANINKKLKFFSKVKNPTNEQLEQHSKIVEEFLLKEKIFLKKLGTNESSMYMRFTLRYMEKKQEKIYKTLSKGEVYFANFGPNYTGEMAYIHPCLVLENFDSKILVVPGTTYKESDKNKVYSFGQKKEGNKNRYLVKTSELDLKENSTLTDTVYYLDEAKLISKARVSDFEIEGTMKNEDTFKEMEKNTFLYLYGRDTSPLMPYKEESVKWENKAKLFKSIISNITKKLDKFSEAIKKEI